MIKHERSFVRKHPLKEDHGRTINIIAIEIAIIVSVYNNKMCLQVRPLS